MRHLRFFLRTRERSLGLVGDILADAARDTLALVPFLFITYAVLEALEHAAGSRVNDAVRRAGAAGPIVGAVAGIFPQCGFSAMGATLYAGRVVTLGTLVAVLLSTSDEMLPIFLAERADAAVLLRILVVKAAIAAVTGIAIDAALRACRRNPRVHAALRRGVLGPRAAAEEGERGLPSHDACGARCHGDLIDELTEAGEGTAHIHRLCDQDHCGCDDEGPGEVRGHAGHGHGADGGHGHDERGHGHGGHGHHGHGHGAGGSAAAHVLRGAISHTVQVTVFIFLITVALVAVLDTVGEPVLEAFLASNRVLAVFAAALVALIPNCAASIVITQLYLEGVLAFGPMMAGSLVGVGIGFLVLFRANRSLRENVAILVLLYAIGTAWGLILTAAGL